MGIACGLAALELASHGYRPIVMLLSILAAFFIVWGTTEEAMSRLARRLPGRDHILACLRQLDRLISPRK